MSSLTANANFPCPITEADRRQALQFSKQQATEEKAEQIYRNTLAILVVEQYLEMLGIETDHSQSYSWDVVTQLTSNVADLYIPEANGRLECRSIKPGEQKCLIPEELLDQESWSDRIGCVVVELNDSFTVGTLLGFVPVLTVEELPLSYLRSLDDLIERIAEWAVRRSPVDVSEWFRGRFSQGWKTFTEVIQQVAPNQPQLSYRFRGLPEQNRNNLNVNTADLVKTIRTTQSEETRWQAADQLWEVDPEHPDCGVSQVNVLEEFSTHSIGLSVGCLRKTDHTLSFFIRVCSLNINAPLPADIEFSLIDQWGTVRYTAKPGPDSILIQKKISVNPNEKFRVRVSQGEIAVEREFFDSSSDLLA